MRLAPLLVCSSLAASASGQDNVLIIVADDVGVDMVACYGEGSDPATTPTIDSLAQSGVLFRNAWSNPACSPTRAQLMTGRHAFRTGIGAVIEPTAWALSLDELTLPEVLDAHAQLGYSHAALGKWHLGNGSVGGPDHPNLSGWAHFAGTLGNITPPDSYFHWDKVVNGTTTVTTTYATTDTVDEAIAWIQSAPEPWLCYVSFNAAHEPFHEPPASLHTERLPNIDPRLKPVLFYKATVEAMDTEIARMFTGIGGAMGHTNVIFLGDNGTPAAVSTPPFVPGHAKLTLYEGGVNVPLIISGPVVQQPGREVTALVGATDVWGTALELAGVDLDLPPVDAVEHDSVSMLPYATDPNQQPLRSVVYAELFNPTGFGDHVVDRQAIRNDRFKLIYKKKPSTSAELFDLIVDPFETTNLLRAPLSPDAFQALMELTFSLPGLLRPGG